MPELTENAKKRKYKYSGYRIEFDRFGTFSFSNSSAFCRNVIIFGADMSSFVHVDNKKKDILILGKVPAQELDDTTLSAKKVFDQFYRPWQKVLRKLAL